MWPIIWLIGIASFFLPEKMSGFYSVCVGRRRRGVDAVSEIFRSMLIKIRYMQGLCAYCHGFFQARFMSLLTIKLRHRSHNQIWCRKLGNSLGSVILAFHSWWVASPPGTWHYGVVCVQRRQGKVQAQHRLACSWQLCQETRCASWRDLLEKHGGHWRCCADISEVDGNIFSYK